eukprot:CAMPEP_0181292072 /NCGR_PEP_ID=MMETSP1101-20121128/2308_1 /TAXON_ID=46948 /ORGANISM="Rhodomonas abbreviata, Strain Caron Lab Isolate" /LENGTH=70 /DNA_ID=CAMNT_0023396511 /DNA_START=22 /DNA_END=234 /DNA_ORIENTATION=-
MAGRALQKLRFGWTRQVPPSPATAAAGACSECGTLVPGVWNICGRRVEYLRRGCGMSVSGRQIAPASALL